MKQRPNDQLREDALAIWHAGVNAVRSDRLVRDNVFVNGDMLCIADDAFDLNEIDRIVVVGAGKAGAGMAAGLEQALGDRLLAEKRVGGWVNVPADCVRPLKRIRLHAARPAGINEPSEEGVKGTEEILRQVRSLGPDDLCLCLISGGGSALLPAPHDGITLAEKQQLTQVLSGAGANISELNTVRKELSKIKGGGLAVACPAGRLITLIISDVIGDPLDVIASGPTVKNETNATDALAVLARFDADRSQIPESIYRVLAEREQHSGDTESNRAWPSDRVDVRNHVIGNNAVAVDAAGVEAERRGYSHAMHAATQLEGYAEDVGRHLAQMAARMSSERGPDCLITGGEPTVQLVDPARRGRGGRNQQLVLAAISALLSTATKSDSTLDQICILSGGTDGEDGPTDAAGAVVDGSVIRSMREFKLSPEDFLSRNDAYHFFEPLGGLILTGPTHTNVCDLRVCVVSRIETRRV